MDIQYDDRIAVRRPRNLWKDALVGVAAGVVGTVAMNRFWAALAALRSDGGGAEPREREEADAGRDEEEEPGALDDMAVVGPYHRAEENATETAGRVLYEKVHGEEPGRETRETLASQVHWATGMALGGAYGLLRGDRGDGLDLLGGLAFGTGAWFTNDELMVPLLGLSGGPTSHPLTDHLQALGAHAVFGVATAAAAQTLEKLL